ncbi:hypothetical protein PpBr36_03560, partial [Pyricularia pennisetigena]|uniref:hypothetical protein n=1 Tax=Pyricularia pennisetigena TaxID=1578925 RepID=UPI001154EBDA
PHLLLCIMVCGKCQKLSKGTSLATPAVKKKSEMYYGSPASSSSSKSSATLGQTGVSKNKLLSKGAKNPYAQYSSLRNVRKVKLQIEERLRTGCHGAEVLVQIRPGDSW